jgi:hypothetical protein
MIFLKLEIYYIEDGEGESGSNQRWRSTRRVGCRRRRERNLGGWGGGSCQCQRLGPDYDRPIVELVWFDYVRRAVRRVQ